MGQASSRFKWLVWGLLVCILALGLLRMLWISKEDAASSSSGAEAASLWTKCLPTISVPTNSNIGMAPLKQAVSAIAGLDGTDKPRLEYVATSDVTIDPVDPQLTKLLEATGETALPRNTKLRVDKGEFWLTGHIAAHLKDGGTLILDEPEPLRLKPADSQSYLVTLDAPANLAPAKIGSARVLPAGTRGSLELLPGKVVELVTLEATSGEPLLYDVPAKLVPIRAFGEKGPSSLTIEAEHPLLNADDLEACAIADNQTYRASVTDVSIVKGSGSNITVKLPSDVLPEWGLPAPVMIAIVSADGKFMAHGGLRVYPRLWGSIIASALTAALLGTILKTRYMTTVPGASGATDWGRWFAGLFINDDDKEPSLSLFQVFFWTIITVWGLFYTYAVTGSLLQMTPQMLTLLGIAGTGSVLARWVGLSRGDVVVKPPSVGTDADTKTEPFHFWNILNTRGQFDLMKLQLLVFTLLLGIYVVCRIAESAAFPVLDTNTLLLLGVSQGVYIGGKLGGTTPLARAQTVQIETNVNKEATATISSEIQNDEKSRDVLKTEKLRLEGEKSQLEASSATPDEISKKKASIDQIDASIMQLETTINDKRATLDAMSKKAVELKTTLDRILKDELKLGIAP
ncbi:hypothetical protein ELI02_34020 [Rhizobium leguminosarum]|uniref:hypothetical protein n=1 Tax=Rhizobium leguminosarum TaxID=384 RepID=UPI001032706A|nr:hypothetical protein [Rhizobium leguminosarum]TAX22766.1 hypothetical protein ELI04_32730 [Rhizobium leguminosarum]TAX43409.1 hypothetical protein ELI02_34020 [Rhizobium leguminosarum]